MHEIPPSSEEKFNEYLSKLNQSYIETEREYLAAEERRREERERELAFTHALTFAASRVVEDWPVQAQADFYENIQLWAIRKFGPVYRKSLKK